MKYSLLISFLVVMILVSLTAAGIQTGCSCDVQKPYECRSRYCRDGKCINYGDSPDDVGKNPCHKKQCRHGCCYLYQVQCVKAPCHPEPRCGPC